jgi:hypothetical protein
LLVVDRLPNLPDILSGLLSELRILLFNLRTMEQESAEVAEDWKGDEREP